MDTAEPRTTAPSPATDEDDVAARHYRALASRYDGYLRWTGDFVTHHAARMIDALELSEDDQLVDLACGTGIYSLAILEQQPLNHPVIGVDPFEEMLRSIPEDAPIIPVVADGLAFSRRTANYDKVLMKEAIHHIADKTELFANLHDRLPPGGKLLLVHVNPNRVAYPLFDAALERCAWWFADPDELGEQLTDAGFDVTHDLLVHEHRVPRDHYFEMVENCYMSVLTSFDDDELSEGLAEMRERHRDRDTLEFPETFDYVTATRR